MEPDTEQVGEVDLTIQDPENFERVEPAGASRYLYIDETTHERSRLRGAIVLETFEPIGQRLIDDAMDALRNDPDEDIPKDRLRRKGRQETLSDGYFHASEGTQDTRSHLCRHIAGRVEGNIYLVFIELGSDQARSSQEETYRLASGLAVSPFIESNVKTEIIIEERSGLKDPEAWLERSLWNYEKTIHQVPLQPYFHPPHTIQEGSKRTPGLQVADFILWAYLRHQDPESQLPWFNRLDPLHGSSVENPRLKVEEHRYHLGKKFGVPPPPELRERKNLPDFGEQSDHRKTSIETLPERVVQTYSEAGCPESVSHLSDEVHRLAVELAETREVSEELLKETCQVFLRIVDTVPLVRGVGGSEGEENVFLAKWASSFMLGDEYINQVRLRNGYLRRRPELYVEHPEFLGLAED